MALLRKQIYTLLMGEKRRDRRGVLNSKSEFDRSHIPRLVLELEEEDTKALRLAREQANMNDWKNSYVILDNQLLT